MIRWPSILTNLVPLMKSDDNGARAAVGELCGDPVVTANARGHVYAERWLYTRRDGIGTWVHRLSRGDRIVYHNHGNDFTSQIVAGGYREFLIELAGQSQPLSITTATIRQFEHHPGSWVFRRAGDYHRFELLDDCPSWSIVAVGPARRDSNVLTPDGVRDWKTYLNNPWE